MIVSQKMSYNKLNWLFNLGILQTKIFIKVVNEKQKGKGGQG